MKIGFGDVSISIVPSLMTMNGSGFGEIGFKVAGWVKVVNWVLWWVGVGGSMVGARLVGFYSLCSKWWGVKLECKILGLKMNS